MTLPWWEKYPGRLEHEYKALEAAGIRYAQNEDRAKLGIIQLDLFHAPTDRAEIHLVATYPDVYPFTKPEVAAVDLELPYHQHPISKNICLLGRSTDTWSSETTLAELVLEQLPKVLAAAEAHEAGEASPVPEEPQGEPYSDYFEVVGNSAILIDSDWRIPDDVDRGSMTFAYILHSSRLLGVVTAIRDQSGRLLLEPDTRLAQVVPDGVRLTGRWVRVPAPPPASDNRHAFRDFLRASWDELGKPVGRLVNGRLSLDLVGVTFREEVQRGVFADGWVFWLRQYEGKMPKSSLLVKALRAGPADLRERTPETIGLANKRVLVLGVGGIGAPAVLELARAGVGRLTIVDHDIVDAGPVVRCPFGLRDAGRRKVEVIKAWIDANLPYTQVTAVDHRIGQPRQVAEARSEAELLDQIFEGVDLVLDLTAEYGIHMLISDLAREKGVPYIEASTRSGAWGGILARIMPAENGPCWICFECFRRELSERDEGPSQDPAPLRQPVGCADPTFTGVGFDVAEFGLAAARLATSTLLRGTNSYPDPGWDIDVINLRERDGRIGSPSHSTRALEFHRECPIHGSRA